MDVIKEVKLTEEEFVIQYVLNRALANTGGLDGVECSKEGKRAYEWIKKNTKKVIDND